MSDEKLKGQKVKVTNIYSGTFDKRIQISSEEVYGLLQGEAVQGSVHQVVPRFRKVPKFFNILLALVKVLRDFFLSRRKTMKRAPGHRVLAAAEFLCSPKTVDQVFEPLVADWQEEYFVALNQNRWTKARWISLRYMWKAVLAFGLGKLFAAVRAFSIMR